jgi:hypothetical protein
MSNENVRLQVRENSDDHDWIDVGHKTGDEDVPVNIADDAGLSMHKLISANTTNATSVKASAGKVYSIQVFNNNASQRFFKFYDKATAPTVGTDTPVKVIAIPGNTSGSGAVLAWGRGLTFANGVAYALTTGVADSDTNAVAANEIVVNVDYK